MMVKRGNMTVSVKSMTLSSAILWGGAMLFVGLIHVAVPSYGAAPWAQNRAQRLDALVLVLEVEVRDRLSHGGSCGDRGRSGQAAQRSTQEKRSHVFLNKLAYPSGALLGVAATERGFH